MKRFVVTLCVVCAIAAGVSAQNAGDFETGVANGAVTITRYTGSAEEVVIPATIGGLPVTSIGRNAFYGSTGLTSISIPASVTSIGDRAFFNCVSLAGISVDPRNATYTSRDGVLFNKAGDTLITYPSGKKGQYAIPAGITGIAEMAFNDCTSLTSIDIPASVTNIGEWAFNDCTGLAGISVDPRNTTYTSRDGVLFNKAGDTLIQYPAGKEERQYAIPSGVIHIWSHAFADCTGLIAISIPAGVTSIGPDAFNGCTGLTSITMPASVTSIGSWAFANCTGLSSINIPAGVTDISTYAFIGCTGLTAILADTNNNHYTSRDGVLFDKTGNRLIQYPIGKEEKQYAIPAGVTSILHGAFFRCTGITSISIPASVIDIAEQAFAGCTGLVTIRIGANVNMVVFLGSGPFENNFRGYYDTSGKKAGVYTFRNGAWNYTE